MASQKSVISWFGGKGKMAKQIINLMPMHKTYVEVFGGGGHIILNKKRVPLEVYNDINIGLVSLFSTLKDTQQSKKFLNRLQLTPYSREEFDYAKLSWDKGFDVIKEQMNVLNKKKQNNEIDPEEFQKQWDKLEEARKEDMLERAVKFYVLCQQSFSAGLESWKSDRTSGTGKINSAMRRYLNGIDENLAWAVERFRTIQIENQSFEYIIERYDSPDTLFYLDPPYIHSTRGRADSVEIEKDEDESQEEFDARVVNNREKHDYHHELTDSMHVQLVEQLLNIKGKFIMSGYDHPIYDRLNDGVKFHKVKLDDFAKACQATEKGAKKDVGEEFLWINFTPGE